MECSVKWIEGGMSFVAETDGAPEAGGRNLGPRPMETVLAGTGACTAFDVVLILKRSGQDVTACKVDVKAERAETDPKVFTKIHMHFVVRGRSLKPSLVESAIKLSHGKYCSASAMLGKTALITHGHEIVEEPGVAAGA
jgi:putative redox protein